MKRRRLPVSNNLIGRQKMFPLTSQVDSRGNSSSPAEALSAGGAGRARVHPEQRHALRFHQQDEEDEAEKVSELPKRSETPHQGGELIPSLLDMQVFLAHTTNSRWSKLA